MDAVFAGPHKKHFEFQKVFRARVIFNRLDFQIALSLQRVQIFNFWISTSKSVLGMPVFSDFDFRISLSPQSGAEFAEFNLNKCSEAANFLTISTSTTFSRHVANFTDLNFKK